MPIHTKVSWRNKRLLPTLLAAFTVASLALPALAVDTGGGGGTTTAAPAVKAPAMKAAAPKTVHLLDLNDARKLIAKSDWAGAIALLRKIVVQQPKNAEALNLLGYSLRNSGDMKNAELYYLKALKLQPKHLGANEYLGELYVLTGDTAKAEARLKVIGEVCGNTTCPEYIDLSKAIAAKA